MKPKGIAGSVLFLAVLPAVLLATGCGVEDQAQKPQKKTPLVAVETAQKGGMVRTLDLTGTVEPDRVAQLASPAEGPVLNLRVREGDPVNAGDVLLTIGRKTGVDALIASLREELKKEEDNLRRTQQLVEKDALPGEQLDLARAGFEKVRAQFVKAEEMSRDYSISAPWGGTVSRLMVKEGDFVAPRTALVEVYDPASLVVRSAVPEKHAAKLHKDMTAEIQLDAYPNTPFSGRVVRLYPYLDERMRTRTIETRPAEEVDLLPGMFARVRLVLESVPDALTVPAQAVVVTPSGASTVFVVVEGKAIRRTVRPGDEDGGRIQILSGLDPGDRVIVSGQEKLQDGAEVRMPGEAASPTVKPGEPKEGGGR